MKHIKKQTRLKWPLGLISLIRQLTLWMILAPIFASGGNIPSLDNGKENFQLTKKSGVEEQIKYPLHQHEESVQMSGYVKPPLETLFWSVLFALGILVLCLFRGLENRRIRQNRQRPPPGGFRIR